MHAQERLTAAACAHTLPSAAAAAVAAVSSPPSLPPLSSPLSIRTAKLSDAASASATAAAAPSDPPKSAAVADGDNPRHRFSTASFRSCHRHITHAVCGGAIGARSRDQHAEGSDHAVAS
jgi:hypothetical protein